MKMFPRSLVLFVLFLIALPEVLSAGKGPVHVRAYTRRDGTYVAAHDRRAPGTASATAAAPSVHYTQPTGATPSPRHIQLTGSVVRDSSASSVYAKATIPDLPHVRENWSPGKIVSGRYIEGHYAKILLRAAASQLATTISLPFPTPTTVTVERDANGRIKRSESAKHSFMQTTGYPNGRSGYVVYHIIPLKRGGADDPSNMQWQTVTEAKAKDKWE
jgi:hypothetical protein